LTLERSPGRENFICFLGSIGIQSIIWQRAEQKLYPLLGFALKIGTEQILQWQFGIMVFSLWLLC
jgi:hypothetical protein